MAAVALGEPGVPVTCCASAALAPNPSAQLTSDSDREARAIRLGNLIVAHCLSIAKYHVQATLACTICFCMRLRWRLLPYYQRRWTRIGTNPQTRCQKIGTASSGM